MYNESPVSDTLLKKLSVETQLVGKLVIMNGWANEPQSQAIVMNVLILPGSLFYRNQFLSYYEVYNKNAVKALKELVKNYPNTHDYALDTGYVLNVIGDEGLSQQQVIKNRSDFMMPEDLALRRQDIFKKGSKEKIKTSKKSV